jgi:hypothetical protein
LFGSLVGSTHVPLQLIVPFGQAHAPLAQICVATHALAQAPQWAKSLVVSMQAPPQFRRLPEQLAAHTPRLQT